MRTDFDAVLATFSVQPCGGRFIGGDPPFPLSSLPVGKTRCALGAARRADLFSSKEPT